MEELNALLDSIDYFKGKKYKIFPIQKWNKNEKFLLEMEDKKYVLITGEKNIKKYKIRLNKLGNYYKEIIGFKYINEDSNVILLDYYGNGKGLALSKCILNKEEDELIANQLKELLDNIHKNKSSFINFSTRFENNNWYEFIVSYMKLYADYALDQKDLKEEDYNFIFQLLEQNKTYFETVPLNYLHGDINEDNVCFNKENNEVYLIDYDDFLIGDILYDYARMFQCGDIPSFQIIKNRYYKDIDNNVIFWIYILRNWLLVYYFEKNNNLEWRSSSAMYHNVLEKLKNNF